MRRRQPSATQGRATALAVLVLVATFSASSAQSVSGNAPSTIGSSGGTTIVVTGTGFQSLSNLQCIMTLTISGNTEQHFLDSTTMSDTRLECLGKSVNSPMGSLVSVSATLEVTSSEIVALFSTTVLVVNLAHVSFDSFSPNSGVTLQATPVSVFGVNLLGTDMSCIFTSATRELIVPLNLANDTAGECEFPAITTDASADESQVFTVSLSLNDQLADVVPLSSGNSDFFAKTAAPVLQRGLLVADFTVLLLEWDFDVVPRPLSCDAIFDATTMTNRLGGSSAVCTWAQDNRLLVKIPSSASVQGGDLLGLLPDKFSRGSCDICDIISEPLALPTQAIEPLATIEAPAMYAPASGLDDTAALFLAATATATGYSDLTVSWTLLEVRSTSNNSLSTAPSLEAHLATAAGAKALLEIPGSLLSHEHAYIFQAECTTALWTTTVNATVTTLASGETAPSVLIRGPQAFEILTSETTRLSATVSHACGSQVSFAWLVDGAPAPGAWAFGSTLVIPADGLTHGTTTEIRVTATAAGCSASVQTSNSVLVSATRGALVANIWGGDREASSLAASFSLHARAFWEADLGVEETSAEFAWNCVLEDDTSTACPGFAAPSAPTANLELTISAVTTCLCSAIATISSSGDTATATSRLIVTSAVTANGAVIQIQQPVSSTVDGGQVVTLRALVTPSPALAALSGTLVWTDASTNRDAPLDLTAASMGETSFQIVSNFRPWLANQAGSDGRSETVMQLPSTSPSVVSLVLKADTLQPGASYTLKLSATTSAGTVAAFVDFTVAVVATAGTAEVVTSVLPGASTSVHVFGTFPLSLRGANRLYQLVAVDGTTGEERVLGISASSVFLNVAIPTASLFLRAVKSRIERAHDEEVIQIMDSPAVATVVSLTPGSLNLADVAQAATTARIAMLLSEEPLAHHSMTLSYLKQLSTSDLAQVAGLDAYLVNAVGDVAALAERRAEQGEVSSRLGRSFHLMLANVVQMAAELSAAPHAAGSQALLTLATSTAFPLSGAEASSLLLGFNSMVNTSALEERTIDPTTSVQAGLALGQIMSHLRLRVCAHARPNQAHELIDSDNAAAFIAAVFPASEYTVGGDSSVSFGAEVGATYAADISTCGSAATLANGLHVAISECLGVCVEAMRFSGDVETPTGSLAPAATVTGATSVGPTFEVSIRARNTLVQEPLSGLETPIILSMATPRRDTDAARSGAAQCRFWNTTEGAWSEAGCTLQDDTSGAVICACTHATSFGGFTQCPAGTQGPLCSEPCPEDTYGLECALVETCSDAGTTNPVDGSCSCTTPGVTGIQCELPCNSTSGVNFKGFQGYGINCTQPCTCDQGDCSAVDGFCTCDDGFTGPNCDVNIDDCQHSLCLNGATCVDGINSFTCSCAAGFTGTFCEDNIDECNGVNCHLGTCIDGINSFTCDCQVGRIGTFCESYCSEGSFGAGCAESCSCVHGHCDPVTGECFCESGFSGVTCSDTGDDPFPWLMVLMALVLFFLLLFFLWFVCLYDKRRDKKVIPIEEVVTSEEEAGEMHELTLLVSKPGRRVQVMLLQRDTNEKTSIGKLVISQDSTLARLREELRNARHFPSLAQGVFYFVNPTPGIGSGTGRFELKHEPTLQATKIYGTNGPLWIESIEYLGAARNDFCICGNLAVFECSKCSLQGYCSSACQKKHWITHSFSCEPTREGGVKCPCGKAPAVKCSHCSKAVFCSEHCAQSMRAAHRTNCTPMESSSTTSLPIGGSAFALLQDLASEKLPDNSPLEPTPALYDELPPEPEVEPVPTSASKSVPKPEPEVEKAGDHYIEVKAPAETDSGLENNDESTTTANGSPADDGTSDKSNKKLEGAEKVSPTSFPNPDSADDLAETDNVVKAPASTSSSSQASRPVSARSSKSSTSEAEDPTEDAVMTGDSISLPRPVQFLSNSSELEPESHMLLRSVARIMHKNPSVALEIGGHTADAGDSPETNAREMQVSQDRANSVVEFLVLHCGIDRTRLTAVGYGDSRPLYDNAGPDRRLNRRVEFVVRQPAAAAGGSTDTAE
eukprot:m.125374 g.125374  ORF g.125374 m.125374 type:complete len:2043 (+) comp9689_c0_seq2:185-6313(+)